MLFPKMKNQHDLNSCTYIDDLCWKREREGRERKERKSASKPRERERASR